MSNHAKPAFDVVVIGAGPAGAASARLLASWGYSVLVLTRSTSGSPALAESLPPSCRKVFEAVGVQNAIDSAGFLMTDGNQFCWDSGMPKVALFGGERTGYQVNRKAFDEVLLTEAVKAGVGVQTGVTVRSVSLSNSGRRDSAVGRTNDGSWHRTDWGSMRNELRNEVSVHSSRMTVAGRTDDGGEVLVHARMVLDCSGRAGVVARRYREHVSLSQSTLALIGIWRRNDGWPFSDGVSSNQTQTIVEAYSDGWAWSVPVSSIHRYMTVMVDPRKLGPDRNASLLSRYLSELRKTKYLASLTEGASLDRAPWARNASQYGAERFGGEHFLLVGDAATFIDPLSSFGVKKAMTSGWLAAVVTNTRLRYPDRGPVALKFFEDWERRVWTSYRKKSADFLKKASRHYFQPFWIERSEPSTFNALDSQGHTDEIEFFRQDPSVQAAFGALRDAPLVELKPTEAVQMTTQPVVVDREIISQACLSLDMGQAGSMKIRYLRGIDLLVLLSLVRYKTDVPSLFEAYQQKAQPIDLSDFLGVLSVLLGKGLLRNEAR